VATKKTPAAKSTRSKRTTATAHKKTPKKASPKKRPPKGQSASSTRGTGKKTTRKPVRNRKKSATDLAEPNPSTRVGDEIVTVDRRRSSERRQGNAGETVQTKEQPKLERRKKVQRRRQIDPTTCERDYSIEEVEFMNALDDYKRKSGRMFPTCSEILEVIRSIGYAKRSIAELAICAEKPRMLEADDDSMEPAILHTLQETMVPPGQELSGKEMSGDGRTASLLEM